MREPSERSPSARSRSSSSAASPTAAITRRGSRRSSRCSRRAASRARAALAEQDLPAFVASAGAYGLLHAHIAKERNVLFPLGARRLDREDDRALRERFAASEREAGGEALHARFRAELEGWKRRLGTLASAAPPHAVAPRG
jgi:hypothetical protein